VWPLTGNRKFMQILNSHPRCRLIRRMYLEQCLIYQQQQCRSLRLIVVTWTLNSMWNIPTILRVWRCNEEGSANSVYVAMNCFSQPARTRKQTVLCCYCCILRLLRTLLTLQDNMQLSYWGYDRSVKLWYSFAFFYAFLYFFMRFRNISKCVFVVS